MEREAALAEVALMEAEEKRIAGGRGSGELGDEPETDGGKPIRAAE